MLRYLLGIAVLAVGCGAPPPPGSAQRAGPAEEPPPAAENRPSVIAIAPPEPEEKESTEPARTEVAVTSASGWSTFHGDAARSGASGAPAIDKPRIRWQKSVGILSWLNSPLVLGKSVVIVPSSGKAHNKPDADDGVVALDLASGKKLWFAHFDQDANGAVASASRVFATSDDGHLYAIELKSGKIAWKRPGSGKMYSYPLLLDSRVIVGDAGGYVRAFAADDGKELWTAQLTGAIRGGASSDGQSVYVASQGGELAALSPATGKPVWKKTVMRPPWNNQGRDLPLEVYAPLVVGGDALFVSFARDTYYTDQPAIYALDKKTGNVKWRAKGPGDWGNVRSTPVLVAGQLVYGEPYSGDVVAINAANGRVTYRSTIAPCYFPQWASPAAAGSRVYLPRFDGALYALEASSGKVAWELYLGDSKLAGQPRPATPPSRYGCEWDVPSGHPIHAPAAVAEDGTVLVGTGEGVLYAIGH